MAFATINKGSSYFNTVLYTGNGASPRSITGVGFKPDFVWSKSRSTAENHNLYDAVRGGANALRSNLANAENASSIYGYVSTFDSDGVTYISGGTNNDLNNGNGVTFVNWNWLGANTTVSNTSGSVTSTVSANTTSGFSVVTYAGSSSNITVGHGLGIAPKMILVKDRTVGFNWQVYHASLGADKYIEGLNTTAAASTGTLIWQNTTPTSSIFYLGGNVDGSNKSGSNQVAYCFAEVKGYSKFGSYTGNGSSDGIFVYTGFKPAFLIVKRYNDAGYDWLMYDNKRQFTFNVVDDFLKPNLADAETTGNAAQSLDFLSNGVKFRGSGASSNGSGASYIYMAFAENPFVLTDGTPVTAR